MDGHPVDGHQRFEAGGFGMSHIASNVRPVSIILTKRPTSFPDTERPSVIFVELPALVEAVLVVIDRSSPPDVF